ncbi:efflux RND transporter periplasmic adaptor subunit [Phaeobacter porticola]|uniref:Putative secretion protein n=1 Tax=Phaeobacter porticola TaxID=1844006 RepID=A0A1L3I8M4_9RHOB|nr:HlyD family efflux transporter periplasmic adaptor subunit [Phaeobacter porticola]APG48426.1 putative secretion protein [Phaeobacter porticola]
MRFLRQTVIGVFLAALTAALLLVAVQMVVSAVQSRLGDERKAPPAQERVFAVNVERAELKSVQPRLTAFGRIESRRRLELRTAAAGRVLQLAPEFEEGGYVTAGTLLVQIDPADAQAALQRVEADMMDAEAETREARRGLALAQDELAAAEDQAQLRIRALERQQDLARRGVGSAATVEVAELAAAQARQSVISRRQAVSLAEARIDQAATRLAREDITLEDARRNLADTTIIAGFDGTLQSVNLVEGRLVSANEKLADLVDPARLDVAFRVSTVQYARLLDAQGKLLSAPVEVTLDASGAALKASGTAVRDSGAAGEGLAGRLIYARLNPAPGFKPGDFVTVHVEEPIVADVARLPSSALGSDGTVLVLGDDNRLEDLPVILVRRQGDDVLLRGERLEGREVVTGRTPLLGAGIKVRPIRQGAEVAKGDTTASAEAELIELSDDHRAKLVAMVEGHTGMPDAVKARMLAQLAEAKVPMRLVNRIETRMGG